MKKIKVQRLIVICLTLLLSACSSMGNTNGDTDQDKSSPIVSLEGRFATIKNFKSSYLKLSRNITVYLPLNYEKGIGSYPVVYMHDGQNLFNDSSAAFGKAWNVDDAYDNLIANELIEPVIIVGINNTSARIGEYTPTADPVEGGGNGENYCNFIVEELIPFINENFRTKTGPEHTAIIGSSLGGLISFYAAEKYPTVFGMAGCVSSSFWWDNRNLLNSIESRSELDCKNVKFWIDAGTAEGSDTDGDGRVYTVEDAGKMAQKLVSLGWEENINLAYLEDVGKAHNEVAWESRIGNILYFFFRKSVPNVSSLESRLYMKKIGITGLNKTWISCDLLYDVNQFRLTRVNTDGIFQVSPEKIIQISNGRVTPKMAGTVSITAKLGSLQSKAVSLEVADSLSADAQVMFRVHCPPSNSAEIFLAGGGGPIPGDKIWHPSGMASDTKVSDTEYIFVFTVKRNSSFPFKFTRTGTWESEEIVSSDRIYTNTGIDEIVDFTVVKWRN